ncbi:MAG TPA: efflux RND transporter periplasmic adaptor subunit [Thiobacillaceae bacterium]|nr:efflux RND transporter periplasmic adaptor subunit [Thiobacillaceae bacterium]
MRKASLRWVIATAAVLLVLTSCGRGEAKKEGPKQTPPVPVTVGEVVRKTVPFQLRAVGNVETLATVNVKSRVDGQIVRVGIKDGQDVAKGQLLFQIDPRPFAAQLKQAEAALLKDQAQLTYAAGQEKRYEDLLQKNFISREAYAQVRANLEAAQAVVKADKAALDNARVQLDYTTIRSPIAGRAGKILVTGGNLVKANDTVSLVVINQLSPIYVSFSVPEQFGGQIRQRHAAGILKVEALPRTTGANSVEGNLAFVDNAVDSATGTLKLRAEFPNTDRILWPGDFAETTLTLRQDNDVVVAPARAVQNGPRGTYVFVVRPDLKVAIRDVVVARTEGADAVIAKGLQAGEKVVTDGASRLTPNSAVKIKGSSSAP